MTRRRSSQATWRNYVTPVGSFLAGTFVFLILAIFRLLPCSLSLFGLYTWNLPYCTPPPLFDCTPYQILVTRPANGYHSINDQVTLTGTFALRPPPESLKLVVSSGGQYWSGSGYPEVNTETSTWSGGVNAIGEFDVIIGIAGPNTKMLAQYFAKAGKTTSTYLPLDALPQDFVECTRISVKR